MAKTLIDIDEVALAAAAAALGTATKRDTVNTALARVAGEAERSEALLRELERGPWYSRAVADEDAAWS